MEGVVALKTLANGSHFHARLRERDAGAKARVDEELTVPNALRGLIRARNEREPEIGIQLIDSLPNPGHMKARGPYANDGVPAVLEFDRLPENFWIAAEAPQEQRGAEHRDMVLARLRLIGAECAAQRRVNSEEIEGAGGRAHELNPFRFVALENDNPVKTEHRHVVERM